MAKNKKDNSNQVATSIFVNLPVKDLQKSIDFFTKLGFSFNAQFTDKNATCMIIGPNIYSMLIVEPYFKTFTKKTLCDTAKSTEVLLAISVDNKSKVDELVAKAIAAGGSKYMDAKDYGFMYQSNFQDLDGHQWEVFYMDPKSAKSN